MARKHNTPTITSLVVSLTWPARALSPNARGHWSAKAKAAHAYRQEAWLAAKASMFRAGVQHAPQWSAATITITGHPPDNTRRDSDNLLAQMKAAIDGLVDAGVLKDDNKIRYVVNPMGSPRKGGEVVVTIEQSGT